MEDKGRAPLFFVKGAVDARRIIYFGILGTMAPSPSNRKAFGRMPGVLITNTSQEVDFSGLRPIFSERRRGRHRSQYPDGKRDVLFNSLVDINALAVLVVKFGAVLLSFLAHAEEFVAPAQ